jgi:mannitol-1-phosphate 5-dehydrogenase
MITKKLVLFGAGKIGRSFIGQLFSAGGYEVVFIDLFQPVIDELNRRKEYNVIIRGDRESVIVVKNVRGVSVSDEMTVVKELRDASIVATAVGQQGLPGVVSLLAKGLVERFHHNPSSPLDVIIAENLRDAAPWFAKELQKVLPAEFPLSDYVGLIETSIGKMVPIMTRKDVEDDILQVFAEEYNTLILDKKGFRNPIPPVDGLAPKDNMKAWVDRKLFIHNLGHAATAYLGFLHDPSLTYLHQVLALPAIFTQVRKTMLQSATALEAAWPDEFTTEMLHDHIDDLLSRFANKDLGDTIFRVGCDLMRKLGPNDRLAGAISMARERGLPYDKILHVLVCACRFAATDEQGKHLESDLLFRIIYHDGIQNVMTKVCGFDPVADQQLIAQAVNMDASTLHLSKD